MNFYMICQKRDPDCPIGLIDAALYDKPYEDWVSVKYGLFPWYANATKKNGHTKLPKGMVLVGKSKKYIVAARSLTHNLYAINSQFYQACLEASVWFLDVELVACRAQAGRVNNEVNYYVASFMKYSAKDVVSESSVLMSGEYGMIDNFTNLKFENIESSVFKLDWMSPSIDTLFCDESFRDKAENLQVLGIDFLPLDKVDPYSLVTV